MLSTQLHQSQPPVLSPGASWARWMAHPGPGLRYRTAFSVAYGGGLRASEVTHLKVGDIDSDRMLIRVNQSKGRKDRHVMLSPSLLDLLRDYWREARAALSALWGARCNSCGSHRNLDESKDH